MEWKDSYNIGVPLIDNQHQELCKRIKNLADASALGNAFGEMGNTIKFLVDYTKHHFSAEEDLMETAGVPNLPDHIVLHKNFIHELTVILVKLRTGKEVNALKLSELMTQWLVNHIFNEDIKTAEFIHKKKEEEDSLIGENAESKNPPTLMKRIKKLKSLFENKLISQDDFDSKKKDLLEKHCKVDSKIQYKSLEKKLSVLTLLKKKGLICSEDEKLYKEILFKNFDLTKLLEDIPKVEDKLKYLKSSLNDELLTSEEYEKHKSQLLDNM